MQTDVQVAIVGNGPVGALLGNLLGRRGISTRIYEKQPTPYGLPRAIHFDGEVMRAFQAAGLAEQVLPSTTVGRGMLFKDASDTVLIDWSRAQEIGPMGWHESYRVHQPGLEAALDQGLTRYDHVSLHRGIAVDDISQTEDYVTLQLSDGSHCTAEYVVGCDGATSTIRDAIGSEVEDLGYRERWLVVDVILTRPRDDLGDYSIQFCDADNPATYVRGVGDRRRWEIRLHPHEADEFSEAEIWDRLQRWITPDDATIERRAVYEFRSCVATKWQQGRCVIAGDAAHQMPPFMGQGMCAGIRDVANLSWKLDMVLKGAPAALVATYGPERQQNVRQFIELTVQLGKLINQTAQNDGKGAAPHGTMQSIWPSLGEGFGLRDGIGGELAPQIIMADGQRADDFAAHGFYLLSKRPVEAPIPVVCGAWDKLDELGFEAALIRPDGYAVVGIKDAADAAEYAAGL